MDRRLLPVAALAFLALAPGCDRPRTEGTAYNNSGSSATPNSASVAPGNAPAGPTTTPAGSEGATGVKSTPVVPDTASANAPAASAVAESQSSAPPKTATQ